MLTPPTPDIQIKCHDHQPHPGFALTTTMYTHFHFPKHFHNHYTIIFIEKGINEGFTERTNYKVGKNEMLIINPGDLHAGNSYQNQYLQFKSLRFDLDYLQQLCYQNEWLPKGDLCFDNRPIKDTQLVNALKGVLQDIECNPSPADVEASQNDFLLKLLRHYSNQSGQLPVPLTDKRAVERARAFIHKNYRDEITLQDMARYSHSSQYHLIRQFKKQFGLSPFQYLRNYRVEKAKELLKSASSISEVAHEVGFFDHSHFLRNFKKMEGIAPSKLNF